MPPELRENGSLLADLEYISEAKAAISLDVSEQTLIGWRKLGIGPPYSQIGRKFIYAVPKIKQWVEAGGTAAAMVLVKAPPPGKITSVAKPVRKRPPERASKSAARG